MKCPNCKCRLPIYSIVLREYTCKNCSAKISASVVLSVTAALMGVAVSGIFNAGYKVSAIVLFVFIVAILVVITPYNIKYTLSEKNEE